MSKHKDKYKVRNWKAYNSGLKRRGSLTLWMSESIYRQWRDIGKKPKVVGEKTYPDVVIEFCLTIKKVYGLKLRQVTGFLEGLFIMMGAGDLVIPYYSTLSRRSGKIKVKESHLPVQGLRDMIVDSTGLKVFGEGEWKVRKHGVSKRRTWRKLHLGIDAQNQEIVSVVLTTNGVDDAEVMDGLLEKHQGKLGKCYGDGAYDKRKARKSIHRAGGKAIVPPPRNAVKRQSKEGYIEERNQAIERIGQTSREEWKEEIGYHRRSLGEVAMFRYKTINGNMLSSRKFDNQVNEVKISCHILNVFRACGMPLSYKIN